MNVYFMMMLYNVFFLASGIAFLFFPKLFVKSEYKENTEKIAKTKKAGIIIIICELILITIELNL